MLPRLILPILLAAVLGGCSVAPRSAYTYDGMHPPQRMAADPAAVTPLTQRIAQLEIQLNDVRAKIASQDDTFKRLDLYADEHRIHRRLAPLQRELALYASAR